MPHRSRRRCAPWSPPGHDRDDAGATPRAAGRRRSPTPASTHRRSSPGSLRKFEPCSCGSPPGRGASPVGHRSGHTDSPSSAKGRAWWTVNSSSLIHWAGSTLCWTAWWMIEPRIVVVPTTPCTVRRAGAAHRQDRIGQRRESFTCLVSGVRRGVLARCRRGAGGRDVGVAELRCRASCRPRPAALARRRTPDLVYSRLWLSATDAPDDAACPARTARGSDPASAVRCVARLQLEGGQVQLRLAAAVAERSDEPTSSSGGQAKVGSAGSAMRTCQRHVARRRSACTGRRRGRPTRRGSRTG